MARNFCRITIFVALYLRFLQILYGRQKEKIHKYLLPLSQKCSAPQIMMSMLPVHFVLRPGNPSI